MTNPETRQALRRAQHPEDVESPTKDELLRAWRTIREGILAVDECQNWETCPMYKLHTAERRQGAALCDLAAIAGYIGIV